MSDDDVDGALVAIDANTLRTHYTASQRAMFAAGIANATKVDAGNMRHGPAAINKLLLPVVTIKQAADLLAVGTDPVGKAKRIARTAHPEVTA